MCFFRLLRVIPERNATFEEAREDLESVTVMRLEEERLELVMCELQEKYGLKINSEAIKELPADPGLWTGL